ncbi:MAG: hypothetical protein GX491_00135 [Chloroflexi bacterium]|nr:hypothetical protein [Chloroflexota bacterium]
MNKQYQIGRILVIISGALGLLWAALIFANLQFAYWQGIVLTIGIVQAVFGLFTLLSGVFSTRPSVWGLGLAGSITGIFTFFPTAVAAIIFVALSRRPAQATAP